MFADNRHILEYMVEYKSLDNRLLYYLCYTAKDFNSRKCEMNDMIKDTGKILSEPSLVQPEVPSVPPKLQAKYDDSGSILPRKPKAKQNLDQNKMKGCTIGSVLLSIVVFAIVLILISTIFVKYVLSEESISTAMQHIDYANLKPGELLTNSDFGLNIENDDTTIDIVYDALLKNRAGISKTQLEEILEKSSFSEYISDKLAQYSRYVLTREKPDEINSDEIVGFVLKNKKEFEKAIGKEITFDELYEMKYQLDTDYREIFDNLSVYKIDQALEENNLGRIPVTLSDKMSNLIMIVAAVLLTIIIVLIGHLHGKARASLIYVSIPVVLAGVTFTAAMITLSSAAGSISEAFASMLSILEPIISAFITKGIIIGVITSVVGLAMIICYALIVKAEQDSKMPTAMYIE